MEGQSDYASKLTNLGMSLAAMMLSVDGCFSLECSFLAACVVCSCWCRIPTVKTDQEIVHWDLCLGFSRRLWAIIISRIWLFFTFPIDIVLVIFLTGQLDLGSLGSRFHLKKSDMFSICIYWDNQNSQKL